jgi:hypothetical protein
MPKINVSKLVLHNLTSPWDKRISARELQAKVDFARQRGNILALWSTFHAQAQAQVQAENSRTESAWQALGQ